MTNIIAIDFVPGTHGHFLEKTLNKFFNVTTNMPETFTPTGTSHNKTLDYNNNRLFRAEHWSELYADQLTSIKKIISIRFDPQDLLLVSSVSLLRAGDCNIDNNNLETDTTSKLNSFYKSTLKQIYTAYPFLDQTQLSIPRYVLREFFKFGFKNTNVNGYWLRQQLMVYPDHCEVFCFNFSSFYNIDNLVSNIKSIEKFVGREFNFSSEFYQYHRNFLNFIPYQSHKKQCDLIIECVRSGTEMHITKLTMFQESYINGCLENIYHKEMPFHQDEYFTSTKDMLYYITNHAPNL